MKFKPALLLILLIGGCSTSPPKNHNDICEIFREKDDWYEAAQQAYNTWGIPVAVQMAIMRQESHFVADAQPPRPWLLGIIPWFRTSSAYGYAQAQDGTWEDYLNNVDNWGADRDDFADSCDFIGWYCAVSHRKLGIAKNDTRNLYLAYHEGHGGYRQKSYLKKKWLLNTAASVANQAKQFKSQLNRCQKEFESKSWFFW